MALHLVGYDTATTNSNTITGTFDEAVAAGNSIVVLSHNNDKRGADVPTSTSLTFTERQDPSGCSISEDLDTAVSKSIGDTVVQNYGSSSTSRLVALLEFDGIAVYKTSTSTSSNGSSPSINRTTSDGVAAGDDVIGLVSSQSASAISTPSGWTEIYQFAATGYRFAAHKKENVSAATQTYNPVCTSGADYQIAMVVYTPPASGTTVNPLVGHMVYAGYAPSITRTVNQTVAPAVGHLVYTGRTPAVTRTANQTVAPIVGHMVYAGYAPAVVQGSVISPSEGHLVYAGYVPGVVQSANRSITPVVGHLVYLGHTPTIEQGPPTPPTGGHFRVGGETVQFLFPTETTSYPWEARMKTNNEGA